MKMGKFVQYASAMTLGCVALMVSLMASAAGVGQPQNKIEKIDFATLPGEKLSIKVTLSQPMQNPPAGFSLTNPSRIALDFPDTASGLSKSTMEVDQGVLRSLRIGQSKGRTRLVLNLSKPSAYTTSLSGKNGEGRVVVDLSDNATGIDIRQQGQKIQVDFLDVDLPEKLERRLNVTDFATPVLTVDTMRNGKNVRMIIEPKGSYEHSAYQADRKFIVDVRPLEQDPRKLTHGSKQGYKGEKLSLNFQDIEVRSVLQVIADFTGFNIITSDNVSGKLTLRLKDVPWDQALDIIMQARGLGMRKDGNVIWIAPNAELAAMEKSRLEAEQGIADLEPLVTQSFKIKYQKAEDVKNLISGRGAGAAGAAAGVGTQRLLSKRGSASVDKLSNTLFVQDTEKALVQVEKIINQIDVPARQVLIESRIVLADDGFSKKLGAKFGALKKAGNVGISGQQPCATKEVTGSTCDPDTDYLRTLVTNLPVTGTGLGTLGVTLFSASMNLLLSVELSASEADSITKTVSSPKVVTANQQKAMIEQGQEIPYQEATSSGATSTSFKKAVLSMEVTPQITPDNKINMDLRITKDEAAVREVNGEPAINTNRVETLVLVDNGETAMLGGIFETVTTKSVDKVPFFGDLPGVGRLFKRNVDSLAKKELLIFITPKLLDDSLKAN